MTSKLSVLDHTTLSPLVPIRVEAHANFELQHVKSQGTSVPLYNQTPRAIKHECDSRLHVPAALCKGMFAVYTLDTRLDVMVVGKRTPILNFSLQYHRLRYAYGFSNLYVAQQLA
ncbi:hypothetical protein L798_14057 [Zootermopsis nevadensis]|uniref:Uncharacterized protein n=1 Tax=Zootermopsis nevadensis TaxID=136037 RepID=A0A067RRM2_ZOONE|nr:hypothetical protein L798_14057 [Zootermopsis nevadensis]